MAYGPKRCASCGSSTEVQIHHLYSRKQGCPDSLTIWLCLVCHDDAHQRVRKPSDLSHSALTRAALARKKAEGALLGNRTNLPMAQAKAAAVSRAKGEAFAKNVLPLVRQAQERGAQTYRAIAEELNQRGVRTARGGTWHATTVRNMMLRTEAA